MYSNGKLCFYYYSTDMRLNKVVQICVSKHPTFSIFQKLARSTGELNHHTHQAATRLKEVMWSRVVHTPLAPTCHWGSMGRWVFTSTLYQQGGIMMGDWLGDILLSPLMSEDFMGSWASTPYCIKSLKVIRGETTLLLSFPHSILQVLLWSSWASTVYPSSTEWYDLAFYFHTPWCWCDPAENWSYISTQWQYEWYMIS